MNDETETVKWVTGIAIGNSCQAPLATANFSADRDVFLNERVNGHEAIISNEKYAEMMKILQKNMDEHIDQRVWSESEDVPCPKPDPEHEEMCGSELWGAF